MTGEQIEAIRSEVTYSLECEPEHIPVWGNFASGDDAADRAMEADIIAQLESGNAWAWCCAKVTAKWRGLESSDYLGGCSYASESDFIAGGTLEDMQAEALATLLTLIESVQIG